MKNEKKIYQKPVLVDLTKSSLTDEWCRGGGGAKDYTKCNNGAHGENR